jgi:Tol biopolymer transport system component
VPDVKEIFDLITEQTPPAAGALQRQHLRQARVARNRRLGAFALVVSMLALGVTVYALTRGSQTKPTIVTVPPPTSPPPPSRFAGAPIPKASFVDLSTGARTPLPAAIASIPENGNFQLSPDGHTLAFEGIGNNGTMQIFISDIAGKDVRQLTDDPGQHFAPSWSRDGKRIVFQTGERMPSIVSSSTEIAVIDLDTGGSTVLIAGDAWVMQPTFSADGSTVLFTKVTGDPVEAGRHTTLDLWTVPAEGGKAQLLIHRAAFGSFSPDGSSIAFLRVDAAYESDGFWPWKGPWIANADGTSQRKLLGDSSHVIAPVLLASARPIWSPDGTRLAAEDPWSHPVTSTTSRPISIFHVANGRAVHVARGMRPSWLDNGTLIVSTSGGTEES